MFVKTAHSGFTISTNRSISPGILIPISITANSVSSSSSNIISATPIWLFKFLYVLTVRYFISSTAAIISFVVVFPTLPVIPMILTGSLLRYQAANFCIAKSVSETYIPAPFFSFSLSSEKNTQEAPASSTSGIKRCASTRSPIIGTNKVPVFTSLESVETFVTVAFSSPQTSLPPTAFTISFI